MTSADGCLLATMAWLVWILPRVFGWRDVFAGRPKLAEWYAAMKADPAGAKVTAELQGGLAKWEENGRWQELGIADQVATGGHQFAF